jgi:hypothetical protein
MKKQKDKQKNRKKDKMVKITILWDATPSSQVHKYK